MIWIEVLTCCRHPFWSLDHCSRSICAVPCNSCHSAKYFKDNERLDESWWELLPMLRFCHCQRSAGRGKVLSDARCEESLCTSLYDLLFNVLYCRIILESQLQPRFHNFAVGVFHLVSFFLGSFGQSTSTGFQFVSFPTSGLCWWLTTMSQQ